MLERAERLEDAVARRGPDGVSRMVTPPSVLAVRRLEVIAPGRSAQPARSEDGQVIAILNGDIYNYRQLRRKLGDDHVLRFEGDAEVLPHLYEDHGTDFVRMLRGPFAIALWDARRGRLVLARDRLGEKPLYYSHRDGTTIFSSLLVSISQVTGPPVIGPTQLYEYLNWGFSRSVDARGEIKRVPPGTLIEFGEQTAQAMSYWGLPERDVDDPMPRDSRATQAGLRAALDDACVEQLPDDGARWALLVSGGLDSSILASHLSDHKGGTGELVTVRFEDCRDGEEDHWFAANVAAQLPIAHREVALDRSQLATSLEEYVDVIDEPVGDVAGPVLHAICSQLAGRQRILYTGAGADEVFAGYPEHAAAADADDLTVAAQYLFERTASIDQDGVHGALRPGVVPVQAPGRPDGDHDLRGATPEERVQRVLALELEHRLPNSLLLMGDRVTMANQMEARSPYLDHRLIEAAFRMPATFSQLRSTPKPALRAIGGRFVPRRVLGREKHGFPSPLVGGWFSNVIAPRWKVLRRDPPMWFTAAFDPLRLQTLDERAQGGDDGARRAIWRIMLLATWSEQTGATVDL